MTHEEQIMAVEDVAAIVGGEVRDNYSGRGMFGQTCYGIDTDSPADAIDAAAAMGLRGAKTDSMGKGHIVYWPDVAGNE